VATVAECRKRETISTIGLGHSS